MHSATSESGGFFTLALARYPWRIRSIASLSRLPAIALLFCLFGCHDENKDWITLHITSAGDCTSTPPILLRPGRLGEEWAMIVGTRGGILVPHVAVGADSVQAECARETLIPWAVNYHADFKTYRDLNLFVKDLQAKRVSSEPLLGIVVSKNSLSALCQKLGITVPEFDRDLVPPFGPYLDYSVRWNFVSSYNGTVTPLNIEDRKLRKLNGEPWPP